MIPAPRSMRQAHTLYSGMVGLTGCESRFDRHQVRGDGARPVVGHEHGVVANRVGHERRAA